MDKDLLRKKIEFLVEFYYGKFDFLRKESLDVLKKKALDKYLDSGLTIEEIQEKLEKEILERKKLEEQSMEKVPDEISIRDNHHSIYETLEELAYLLRMANVDYYIEGGLAAYLKYDEESSRTHDNINITIEKKDFDKFKSMCDILGISVVDKGIDVLSKDEEKADIVMSSFERLEDGSIKRVCYDDGNEIETIFNPKLAEVVYGDEKVNFKGYSLNIIPAEYIFFIKDKSDNNKDKIDADFLRDRIDSRGLRIIQDCSNYHYEPDELSSMMNDNVKDNENDPNSKELSTAKQKVLEKTDNDHGYASTSAISVMSILGVAIMIICILALIMYLR